MIMEIVFLIFFILVFFIQLGFLFRNYFRMVIHVWENKKYNHEGISLIIASRNDGEWLLENLDLFLNQKHGQFECIIVDDGSDIPFRAPDNPRLRILRIDKSEGKKAALIRGAEMAQYEVLLFSDADCEPASPFWAGEMLSNLEEDCGGVLGYGAYKTEKNLLGNLIQLDSLYTVSSYMSAALRGKAYMGVGRNLLLRKSHFFEAVEALHNKQNLYGDDDLIVQLLGVKYKMAICLHPRGFTYSRAMPDFGLWFRQKRRHISAGHYYDKKSIFALALERSSLFLFFLMVPLLLCSSYYLPVLLSLSLYLIYKFYIFSKLKLRFHSPLHMFMFPVWDFIYVLCLFNLTITSIFVPEKKWR